MNDRPRGRPPRCTTSAQDQQITTAAADIPFTNAVAIRDALHLEVSAAKKECLTEQHRAARFALSQRYVDVAEEFWNRAIFPDEKIFCSSAHGKIHCWRRNGTR